LSAALEKSGFEAIDGFNSGKLIGYATATATIDPRYATRDSSETSFLQEAADKTSIKIYPDALRSRILFDDQKRAIGVEVKSNLATIDYKYTLSARKEVILSEGVVGVPVLTRSVASTNNDYYSGTRLTNIRPRGGH
jgi:choline dehydrogenase